MSRDYDASSIAVLRDLEPVRQRPAMYIGGVDWRGLHHLVREILDNAVDEAINGHATTIEVELTDDLRTIEVGDNGRGIPVDKHPETKKSALETIFTTLHAGGKFDNDSYVHSGGLHGVGSSVVNALSEELVATVRRDGSAWQQTYVRGAPTGRVKKIGSARGTGTTIRFTPDPQIFKKPRFQAERVRDICEARSYLHRGLRIVYRHGGKTETFRHEEGVVAFLKKLIGDRGARQSADLVFECSSEADPRLELALTWTDETGEHLRSFANGVQTPAGGAHESGLKAGVVKAVRGYIETHSLEPRGVSLAAEDIREGLSCVLSVYLKEPQFQGQTKDKLNNPEIQAPIANVVATELEAHFNRNGTIANAIIARVILAARARAASRAAAKEVKRKSASSQRVNLPGKLADCQSTDPSECELFIVEGDSAGGTAKQGRDRKTQAILALRGKVLNTEQATMTKILANKELSDIVSALGCGIGKNFSTEKLRYERIIILTDADSDGHHIATLLLTFFYRHLPELIRSGHIYLGLPPLFRIVHKGKTHWAWDEAARDRLLASLGNVSDQAITRFKGLGEMSPAQLKVTAMDPDSRTVERILIADELATDQMIAELMGKDASARQRYVTELSADVEDLDI